MRFEEFHADVPIRFMYFDLKEVEKAAYADLLEMGFPDPDPEVPINK